MTVEEALRDRIVAEVAPAGGAYQLIVPPHHNTWPAVRVQLIDQPVFVHTRGLTRLWRSRVQIDVFVSAEALPDPYDQAASLADAIENALGPEPFTDTGSPIAIEVLSVQRFDRDASYETDVEPHLVRVRQDFTVWHRSVS